MKIKISSIVVEDRARTDFGEVGELAQSIKERGLLHPIILDGLKLIAGERRLRAHELLKLDTIECNQLSNLSPLEQKEIELAENKHRKNLNWQEECKLVEEILALKQEKDPSYKASEDLTLDTGKSGPTIFKQLALAKGIDKYPELAKEKDQANAYRKLQRLQEKDLRKLMVEAGGVTIDEVKELGRTIGDITIRNMDCVEGIKLIKDNSIDLLITDFPFGVDLDKNYDFQKSWDTVYKDTTSGLLDYLLPNLAQEFERVLKPGAHFYIFFPSLFYQEFYSVLSKFLTVQKIPLIWDKRTGGTSFRPYSIYTPNYEPIWYGWKGKEARKLSKPGKCMLNFDNMTKKVHPAEKPLRLIEYLIGQSSIEGECILETFSGSGVTMEACMKLNRKGIAFELEPSWYELAIERLTRRLNEDNT